MKCRGQVGGAGKHFQEHSKSWRLPQNRSLGNSPQKMWPVRDHTVPHCHSACSPQLAAVSACDPETTLKAHRKDCVPKPNASDAIGSFHPSRKLLLSCRAHSTCPRRSDPSRSTWLTPSCLTGIMLPCSDSEPISWVGAVPSNKLGPPWHWYVPRGDPKV